jgi:aspartyl protease family protein
VQGQAITIQRSGDGHYHWPGRIGVAGSIGSGGALREIEFLVDTGATGTAIPSALARELGLQVVGSMQSNTAGGVVQGQIVLADLQLDGGVRAERLRVAALPQLGAPLLGMDVLGRLAWRQDGGVLRVAPSGSGT